MKKKFALRKKIILFTTLVVLGAMLVSGVYFSYTYYSTLKQDAYDKLNSSIDQTASSLSGKFSNIDNASFAFLATPHMRRWKNGEFRFSDDTPTTFNTIAELRSDIEYNLMFSNAWLSGYLDTVYLFADGKAVHLVSRKAEGLAQSQSQNESVYQATKDFPQMSFYYLSDQGTPTVYMIRKMNDITQKKQLTLILTINSDSIAKELRQLDPSITADVIYKNRVFFSNNRTSVASPLKIGITSPSSSASQEQITDQADHTYFLVYRNLYNDLFSIEISVPRSVITQQVFRSMRQYVIVMIVLVLIFTVIAGFTAGRYTEFIRDLATGLNQVRKKNYDVVLPNYNDTDLNSISSTFNNMAAEIKSLINTVYKSDILLKESRIKLLQSQINPHFLVNTLTTISTAALLHGDRQTYDMVTALCNILDASLYITNTFIPVAKEIEHIQCYLFLQHARFQDKLNYNIEIESDDLLKLYIPQLSIEPLVENAVVHGIEENVSAGMVTVSIRRDGEDLLAVVTDNGKGFDAEKVMREENLPAKDGHHIGINNTDKRIRLLFGEKYGIHFQIEPGVKTRAYIRFPVLTTPGERSTNP